MDHVRIQTHLDSLKGEKTDGGAGAAYFDADGIAECPINVAAAIVAHEGFGPCTVKDSEAIDKFLAEAVPVTDGSLQVPGTPVTICIPELAGQKTIAPDNAIVEFDAEGNATAGEETVLALSAVYPDLLKSDEDETAELVESEVIVKSPVTTDVEENDPVVEEAEVVPVKRRRRKAVAEEEFDG